MLADGLDMLGPWIDQRHVIAGARQMTTEISADRAGAYDCNPFLHGCRLLFLVVSGPQRIALGIKHVRRAEIDSELPFLTHGDGDIRPDTGEHRSVDLRDPAGKNRFGTQRL